MYYIELANGVRYIVDWCGAASGVLNIAITYKHTVLELAQMFSNAEATASIIFHYGQNADTHEGYTHLILVQENDGMLVQLRKE